jgi:GntR family transcriptional regulator
MPAIERPLPPYMQVIAHIRGQIENGELRPGDMVPSDRQIADEYQISRATAQKVLTSLRAEGLVESVPGVGTRVLALTTKLHHTGRDRASAVRRTGRIYSAGEYARILTAEITAPPEEVATALGLETGAPAIRRLRVTYGPGDRALSTSTSWYDAALADSAPRLLEAERIPEGSWAYLEAQTGRRAVYGQDSITARLATTEEIALLQLSEPAAVKQSITVLRDGENSVVEYGVSINGGDRQSVYEYELD